MYQLLVTTTINIPGRGASVFVINLSFHSQEEADEAHDKLCPSLPANTSSRTVEKLY